MATCSKFCRIARSPIAYPGCTNVIGGAKIWRIGSMLKQMGKIDSLKQQLSTLRM